jgi:hypothetical protein
MRQTHTLLPMNTAPGFRRLFIDLQDVARMDHVRQTVCAARKHPLNPLLRVGLPHEWDGGRASPWPTRSVVFDPRRHLFQCWYMCAERGGKDYRVAYAESEDGVAWRKPRLGQVEFAGSRENNLFDHPAHACTGFTLDLRERNPRRRYKALGHLADGPRCLCYSPDGLAWTRGEPLVVRGRNVTIHDVVAFLRDDQDPDPRRRWKLVWQDYGPSVKPGPRSVRHKFLAAGPVPHRLTRCRHNPFLSPNKGREQEIHFLAYFPYEGLWLSAFEFGYYLPNRQGVYGQYHADIRLAASRDGERFERVCPDDILLPRGGPGEWDAGFQVITQAPVFVGEEIWFFYSGMGEDWSAWPPGNNPRWPEHRGPASTSRDQMGLAILRRDGFACLEVADRSSQAWVLTRPLEVTQRSVRLVVNVGDVAPGRSWVAVEALDAGTGRPLPGFAAGDCDDVGTDRVSAPVTWRGRPLAAALIRGTNRIRLRFRLFGRARLYAYGFEKERKPV